MFTNVYCHFITGILFLIKVAGGTELSDVTSTLFPGNIPHGVVISAYGDYNADKLIDIFVLTDGGKRLDILLAQDNNVYTQKTLYTFSWTITSVMPADFNGDALMDVLVTAPNNNNGTEGGVTIYVCWGTDHKHEQGISDPDKVMEAQDQPTLFEYNQDMQTDLLVAEKDQNVAVVFSRNRNFTKSVFHYGGEDVEANPIKRNQSNAFIDMDGDYLADLVLCTKDGYQVLLNQGGHYQLNYTVKLPPEVGPDWMIGQVAFADLDQDGLPNILVPVCKMSNGRCINSTIYGLAGPNDTMRAVFNNFNFNGKLWGFTPPTSSWPWLPITLRFGDYNMDGFPDMLLFLQYPEKTPAPPTRKAVLFENVACAGGSRYCLLNRTFVPDVNTEINAYTGAVLGSFFDLYEDGLLDILLVTMTEAKNKTRMPVLRAIRQTSTTDTCFIKITVTNGLCYKDCLDIRQEWCTTGPCPNTKPYGVNVPGPVVKYRTVSVNGDKQASSATQLPQSANFALQLPFVMFGLGMTPNFVDTVGVGIPVLDKKTNTAEQRDWTQIIPNAQLVVIPYPNDEPESWVVKLFVTPSQSVLITGAALLGTCGFVAGIIGILHWQERREDMKEKRQEAHKFHFDAM